MEEMRRRKHGAQPDMHRLALLPGQPLIPPVPPLSPDLASRATASLQHWEPERWPVSPDWQPVIKRFLSSGPAQRLGRFVQDRLAQGATVYPPQPFRALELTPLERVKVVILGQDPYHGPGQAQGLAFSVAPGIKLPPSLRNIFKEIARAADGGGGGGKAHIPANGSLEAWAHQGVLLLNTCLTVELGSPASHAMQGWEALTDAIMQAVASNPQPVAFMLWGAHAQAKRDLVAHSATHEEGVSMPNMKTTPSPAARLVLAANHPSPLSALRPPAPFIGCNHFGAANSFLKANGLEPIAWT